MSIDTNAVVVTCSGFIIITSAVKEVYNMFGKPRKNMDDRIRHLEDTYATQAKAIDESRYESKILCKGMLACLRGLQEQGCNGPVTAGIAEIEEHLLDSSH